MPYMKPDKIVFDFLAITGDLQLIIPFNWPDWDEGKKIFKKHGYITTEEEAMKYALNAKIGGEYDLPYQWGAQ